MAESRSIGSTMAAPGSLPNSARTADESSRYPGIYSRSSAFPSARRSASSSSTSCFPFRPPLGKQLVNDTAALKVRPKPLLDLADHSQAAASQSDPIVVYVQDYILARCQAEFLSQFGR